ncbi:MAG: hypothetical protein ABIQ62_08085 [Thermomonas sp.]
MGMGTELLMFNFTKKPTDNEIEIKKNAIKAKKLAILDHEVERSSIKQTIVWTLEKMLEEGHFLNFKWSDPSLDTSAFGEPKILGNGNKLTIEVLNYPPPPDDQPISYPYVIEMLYKGETYTSRETVSENAVMRDPIIINR